MSIGRILALVLTLSTSGGSAAALGDSPPARDSTGTLRGRVFLTGVDRPARYAGVVVLDARRGAQTDDAGCFVIRQVPAGEHTLRIVALDAPTKVICRISVAPGNNDVGNIVLADPSMHDPPPVQVGAKARVRPEQLEASIRPRQPTFRVGDGATFDVRIRNRSTVRVLLPRSLEASETWASPGVTIEINGPPGGFVLPPPSDCVKGRGVKKADFSWIKPGKDFNPCAHVGLGEHLYRGRFAKPGHYTAVFRYVTNASEPHRWTGRRCTGCAWPPGLRELVEQVPAVDLTATTTFEVVR